MDREIDPADLIEGQWRKRAEALEALFDVTTSLLIEACREPLSLLEGQKKDTLGYALLVACYIKHEIEPCSQEPGCERRKQLRMEVKSRNLVAPSLEKLIDQIRR